MAHIERKKVAYRGELREVLAQANNTYQIKFGRKVIRVKVDPYSGSVSI